MIPLLCYVKYIFNLEIIYITIDSKNLDGVAKIFGYSFFPLFVNRMTEEQPRTRSENASSVLRDGHYQLPIYCQPLSGKTPFYVEEL